MTNPRQIGNSYVWDYTPAEYQPFGDVPTIPPRPYAQNQFPLVIVPGANPQDAWYPSLPPMQNMWPECAAHATPEPWRVRRSWWWRVRAWWRARG